MIEKKKECCENHTRWCNKVTCCCNNCLTREENKYDCHQETQPADKKDTTIDPGSKTYGNKEQFMRMIDLWDKECEQFRESTWKEELEDLSYNLYCSAILRPEEYPLNSYQKKLKSLICQVEQKAMLRQINYDEKLRTDELQRILEAVEGMKKEIVPIKYEPNPLNTKLAYHEQTLRAGYNQALQEVEKIIKNRLQ